MQHEKSTCDFCTVEACNMWSMLTLKYPHLQSLDSVTEDRETAIILLCTLSKNRGQRLILKFRAFGGSSKKSEW